MVPAAEPNGKRPLSLWLLVIACVATMVVLIYGATWITRAFAARADRVTGVYALIAMCTLACVAPTCAVLIGILKRKQWGRWLSVLLLGALAVALIVVPGMPQAANGAQRAGALPGERILLPALVIWWAYGCAFSRKARAYFGT